MISDASTRSRFLSNLSLGWFRLRWYATGRFQTSTSTPIRISFWPVTSSRFRLNVSSRWSASMSWSAKPNGLSNPTTFRISMSPSVGTVRLTAFCTSSHECLPSTVQTPRRPHALNAVSRFRFSSRRRSPVLSLKRPCSRIPCSPTTFWHTSDTNLPSSEPLLTRSRDRDRNAKSASRISRSALNNPMPIQSLSRRDILAPSKLARGFERPKTPPKKLAPLTEGSDKADAQHNRGHHDTGDRCRVGKNGHEQPHQPQHDERSYGRNP